jgi:adenylate kinase family enzyme
MNKIIVIGCPGSGKTTFAEKLNKITNLQIYYLDAIWHRPDRTHISRNDFDARISEIFSLDQWIIDGNYSRTLERRIIACDTVFLFDLPTEICLQGATERLGKGRYDIPWIDIELDPKLKEQIEQFKTCNLPEIYRILDKYSDNKQIVIFKSRKEADDFIDNLERKGK